ncbi:MAG: imidazole glycerol phosphate synthase subunit HisF [Bacteroidetes bacterium]|nr:MAG: imidazole glycerol phosphate synthase subunit HisF [Bacteroidota bacterium]
MLRYRIIPVLLLKNNGLVKTIKFKNPAYVGDPINAVKIFNEKEVDELVILDITATCEKRELNYNKIEEIVSEAFMPVGYGGGIYKLEQIEKLFKLGIEKVIINSAAYSNPSLIKEAAEIFGNQSIVVAIDIKKDLFGNNKIYSHSGSIKQSIDLKFAIKKFEDSGAGEIFINSIDKDGTMTGYDDNLIRLVSEHISIPVVASGGAGKIEHFANAIEAGASAVAAGSMFVFHGKHRAVLISYPKYSELEEALRNN